MSKPLIAALALAMCVAPASAIELAGVKNAHDPGTITKDGDTYFNFTTGEKGIWHSSSKDLLTWSEICKLVVA
ncbi:arabinan endo-1,5-alpha-L-arabinosidase [Massilia genomosp. 1]|uniref:Beta-xylosidase n=1 Tax=Massilia genomosp. 1 TaxID=2609280 RepID=A0ABX0N2L3_9BURK|nr:arabinan endo-1,5-alpha-L-arabinosidase [Massilia genomosp. 1]NHZ66868.1 hypothetical protein [Massilia genomosp. 1]